MIISHKHKFIFIKTKKTAGTSLEMALCKFLGDEDIVTPISGEDEERRKNMFGRSSQNYLWRLSEYTPKDFARLLLKGKRAFKYYNHIPGSLVQERLGTAIFDDYFKFSVD